MKRTITGNLLDTLNAKRGVVYPNVGYSYYADIHGEGSNRRSIYTIINEAGGVTYSSLNGQTPRETCHKLRHVIANS